MKKNITAATEIMIKDITPIIDFYKKSEIVGVVLYGGWARGGQIINSDVDIGVICQNQEVLKDYLNRYDNNWKCKNHIIEITYYDYEYLDNQLLPKRYFESKNCYWTEDNRFNWQQSIVLCDTNNMLLSLIKKKAKLPLEEQKANTSALKWEISRVLNYVLPRLVASQKYTEAQITMNKTIMVIFHYINNKNGLLMPYERAAFYWFDKNKIPGKESIEKLFINSKTDCDACKKRMQEFWQICEDLGIRVKRQTIEEFLESFFDAKELKL